MNTGYSRSYYYSHDENEAIKEGNEEDGQLFRRGIDGNHKANDEDMDGDDDRVLELWLNLHMRQPLTISVNPDSTFW